MQRPAVLVSVLAVVAALIVGLGRAIAQDADAAADKALVSRYVAEASRGDPTVVAELIAPDYVLHVAGFPPVRGVEGFLQRNTTFRAAFPDAACAAEDLVAEGDTVAARWSCRGTHEGEFFGVPATGRVVELTGISLIRVAGGRIAEDHTVADLLGLLGQLGVEPSPGAMPGASPAVAETGTIGDEAGLAAALRARGFDVEAVGPVEQPFLQVVGTVLLLSGGELAGPAEVQVYAYPDAAAAEADAGQIGPEGQPATTMITWMAPPHFFRQGRLLVLYVGDDPAMLALLTELLGPQFAGQ